ncbi:MAG TPA: SRPBCC domain-containing protein, partial [Burkholderiaceae bacterium]|nr:SRPBCC domain-containing protein [Burkholderiaceae bacterium]
MKVQLEKSYPMPASADTAWALLQDIEGVASCMPGAKITERIDAEHYKGTVAVKLGPASLSFRGEIEVKGVDAVARSLHLFAKGTDTTGGSAASMDL